MEEAIIVDHLTKNFEVIEKEAGILGGLSSLISPKKKTVHALREISFSIKPGELVGFIGPNGAGKTTTLKVLSGLLYPTSGFTQVLGFDPWERDPRLLKEIALVMGQKNQLWWDLPAIDTLELNKAIYEIPEARYKESFEELVNMLDVKKLLKTQVRRLSLGQRMRLELVAALIHRPKVLFLDEPTIGLDVVAQAKMRDFIHDYNRRHEATIILTSHNMDDVIDLAKRVIVVDKGKILFDGEIRKLISQYAKEKIIKVYLSKESDVKELEKVGKIEDIEFPLAVLRVPRATAAAAAAEVLHRLPVVDLNIEEEALEEIIRKIFSGEIKINKKK
jgi:ABC-2 type transport system ATP-binding protein